jgi:beta-xylosidase
MANILTSFSLPVIFLLSFACGRDKPSASNETYSNPIISADYSDPDVIRVGNDYYMVSSSFNCIPGLPVLHSMDLVHWELEGYALARLQPDEYYSVPRHGGGVWAPCIRYHNGEFYIYYPDPDYGIYLVRAKNPVGPWSEPLLVKKGKGLIDPSPLWDDDGNAYMVYAFAGSRAGVKSVLMVSRMNAEGTSVGDEGIMVFDGHETHPTVEGPKFYKRNGYYYIFAPAGGVTNGWQLILRSGDIYGPYEERVAMHQGTTDVNGPHQGAWITTPSGEDWFIHFQEKGPYGRIVHLQPVRWTDDWPVIGSDDDNDGTGEPVASFSIPQADKTWKPAALPASDEFSSSIMGLQWQWHANPSLTWGYPSKAYGCYRLNCVTRPDNSRNLWDIPNLFLQKLPAEEFTATSLIHFRLRSDGEEVGMVIMGQDYQYISLKRSEGSNWIRLVRCSEANVGSDEVVIFSGEMSSNELFFRVKVEKKALCSFSYSTDGTTYIELGTPFRARAGMWIGAKIGFFALRDGFINDTGYGDIDWVRIEK